MKGVVMFLMLSMLSSEGFSQNWNEWVRQKRTEIRYLVQQIAALQVYIELGQEGYGIYRDGLEVIGDIKDGEFSLHKDYFASLSAVKPAIGNYPKVKKTIEWHRQIRGLKRLVGGLELGEEREAVLNLFAALVRKSNEYVDQLQLLVTDGKYQLNDKERADHIEKVYAEMLEIYDFARSVYSGAVLLGKQKKGEMKDVRMLRLFHGLE